MYETLKRVQGDKICITTQSRKPESRRVARKAMRLIYFLPAPGFRVKHGMTIAGTRHGEKGCLFIYAVYYNNA